MLNLMQTNENECVWVKLLNFLDNPTDLKFRCGKCFACKHKDGDLRMPVTERYWTQTTPKLQIPVYSLSCCNKEYSLDPDLLKKLLSKTVGELHADPPSWVLVYVPKEDGDANKKTFLWLAQELGLQTCVYLEAVPCAGSMAKAYTQVVREEIVKNKFRFLNSHFPADHFNILIYDDAMKSGLTLDHVCAPFFKRNPNRKIVAFVNTIWNGGELSEPECNTFDL